MAEDRLKTVRNITDPSRNGTDHPERERSAPETPASKPADAAPPERRIVICTDGMGVRCQEMTMTMLEAKAALEMVHQHVVQTINNQANKVSGR